MADVATGIRSSPALEVSQAIFELMMSEHPPRFPRVAQELGLAPGALKMLQTLTPGEQVPMRHLAEALFCDASNVTSLVDRLEQRGIIERRPDPDDRRVKRIALTQEGEAFRARAMERLFEPPAALRTLSEVELEQLRDLLRKALDG